MKHKPITIGGTMVGRVLIVATTALVCIAVAYAADVRKFSEKTSVPITTSLTANASTTTTLVPLTFDTQGAKFGALKVNVGSSVTTARGFGLLDTCTIAVRAYFADGTYWHTLDSTKYTAIPCSTIISPFKMARLDTLYGGSLRLWIRVADTCSDTVQSATYPVWYQGYVGY